MKRTALALYKERPGGRTPVIKAGNAGVPASTAPSMPPLAASIGASWNWANVFAPAHPLFLLFLKDGLRRRLGASCPNHVKRTRFRSPTPSTNQPPRAQAWYNVFSPLLIDQSLWADCASCLVQSTRTLHSTSSRESNNKKKKASQPSFARQYRSYIVYSRGRCMCPFFPNCGWHVFSTWLSKSQTGAGTKETPLVLWRTKDYRWRFLFQLLKTAAERNFEAVTSVSSV